VHVAIGSVGSVNDRRRAARVILVNERNEVLLLQGSDPARPEQGRWWLTPGGGVDEGESLPDAARREVFEETGAVLDDLGDVVFTRSAEFEFNEVFYRQDEWYFVARVTDLEPTFDRFEAHEVASITSWKWWSREELRATTEMIYPTELAELLDKHAPL
jgi:8-oxo-dGTP pyrophosphatase MutT (NUDIX family)